MIVVVQKRAEEPVAEVKGLWRQYVSKQPA